MVEKILDGQNLGVMPTGTAPAVPGFHIHATPPCCGPLCKSGMAPFLSSLPPPVRGRSIPGAYAWVMLAFVDATHHVHVMCVLHSSVYVCAAFAVVLREGNLWLRVSYSGGSSPHC
jgi:hypothetical protein